jgi:hypothetical protein
MTGLEIPQGLKAVALDVAEHVASPAASTS